MEAFEIYGWFWLPNHEDVIVNGLLSFSPEEGTRVQFYDLKYQEKILTEFKQYGIGQEPLLLMHGQSTDGRALSLHNVTFLFSNHNFNYLSGVTFYFELAVEYLFINYPIQLQVSRFNEITFSTTYLNNWVGKTGFQRERVGFGKEFSSNIGYRFPEPFECELSDYNLIVKIDFMLLDPTNSSWTVSQEQRTRITLIATEGMAINEYFTKFIDPIANFVTLGLNKSVSLHEVSGKNSDFFIEIDVDEHTRKRRYPPIDIYFPQWKTEETKKEIFNLDMLFGLEDIEDNFPQYLANWIKFYQNYHDVVEPYFSLYNIPHFQDVEILVLAQVLETYHRERYGGKYLSDDEYRDVRKAMLDSVPKGTKNDLKSSLANTLQYTNEYSLRKRLKLLINSDLKDYKALLDKLFSDKNRVVDLIVDTRNYYTHRVEDLRAKAITDTSEKRFLIQKMRLLIQLCFIKEIDIPPATIQACLERNRMFGSWCKPI